MSKASPWGIAPLSFTGTESYAYSYSSHSYSSHSYSSHSYSGASASPMLSIGISNARSDLINGLAPAGGGSGGVVADPAVWTNGGPGDGLPAMSSPAALRCWAPAVRDDLALFELMSRLVFRCNPVDYVAGAALFHVDVTPTGNASGTAVAYPIANLSRPSRAFFDEQLDLVDSWASSRNTSGPEVMTQLDPPIGYFASIANLHVERTPRTLRLIALAQHFAYLVGMQFKHALACPRPVEYSAFIQPMVETPAHASLPAGHAVESFMAAGVIEALVPGFVPGGSPSVALRRLAHRIALNRVIAGLHFPVDCVAGELLGQALAGYFVALCRNAGDTWTPWTFDGAGLKVAGGSGEHVADIPLRNQRGCTPATTLPGAAALNPILGELWKGAWNEWPASGARRAI
jgi:membrane-associated phospholipid phosphatase